MKYLFAADIHGSSKAAKRILYHFYQFEAKQLFLLGDLLHAHRRSPFTSKETSVPVLLNTIATQITAVSGNNDQPDSDFQRYQFSMKSVYHIVRLGTRDFFLTHGHKKISSEWIQACSVFCYGHTHLPAITQHVNKISFNPGSAGEPRGSYPASFGVYDAQLDQLAVKNLETGTSFLTHTF